MRYLSIAVSLLALAGTHAIPAALAQEAGRARQLKRINNEDSGMGSAWRQTETRTI